MIQMQGKADSSQYRTEHPNCSAGFWSARTVLLYYLIPSFSLVNFLQLPDIKCKSPINQNLRA